MRLKSVAIDLRFLKRRFAGLIMQAIRKSAYRAKLQIVWRNRFPVRREKRAGVLLLVEKEQQIASNSWVQRLIRFFRLSVLCKALWHVRSLP